MPRPNAENTESDPAESTSAESTPTPPATKSSRYKGSVDDIKVKPISTNKFAPKPIAPIVERKEDTCTVVYLTKNETKYGPHGRIHESAGAVIFSVITTPAGDGDRDLPEQKTLIFKPGSNIDVSLPLMDKLYDQMEAARNPGLQKLINDNVLVVLQPEDQSKHMPGSIVCYGEKEQKAIVENSHDIKGLKAMSTPDLSVSMKQAIEKRIKTLTATGEAA